MRTREMRYENLLYVIAIRIYLIFIMSQAKNIHIHFNEEMLLK